MSSCPEGGRCNGGSLCYYGCKKRSDRQAAKTSHWLNTSYRLARKMEEWRQDTDEAAPCPLCSSTVRKDLRSQHSKFHIDSRHDLAWIDANI